MVKEVSEPFIQPSLKIKVSFDGLGERVVPICGSSEIVPVATIVSKESSLPVTEVSVKESVNVPPGVVQPSVKRSSTPTGTDS